MAISPSKETEIIDYPISFPIKIIGPSIPDFEALILDILRKYAPDVDDNEISINDSKTKKYMREPIGYDNDLFIEEVKSNS